LLDLPENGKTWNYNQKSKKWELECEVNYSMEKVSVRDFHKCKLNGQWASPSKVVVKCEFSAEAIHEEIQKLTVMEEKITELIDDVSEMTEQLSDDLSMSNLTNEILCTYYDCSGFDSRNDVSKIKIEDPKIKIDGPISMKENNSVGKINDYFVNYEFSFEVKANQLTAIGDLSISVGPVIPNRSHSLIYLFHGLVSGEYKLWFSFFGTIEEEINPSYQRYDQWHKFQFIQSSSDGINCVKQLKLNGEQIWNSKLTCPAIKQGEQGIWMTGQQYPEYYRLLDGQIKNFKFYTHDL